MGAYLEIVDGRSAGRRFALGAGEATIGRDEACEVSLLDESASRRHAAVARRGERFFVRDLGSRNGTWLNGATLRGEEAIRSGDEVVVGATRLRFTDEAERTRDTAPLPPGGAAGAAAGAAAAAAPREEFHVERAIGLEGGGPELAAPSPAERRLRTLLALGRLIASADDPHALLREALCALPATLGADRAVAAVADRSARLDLEQAIVEPRGAVPSRALLERALGGDEALLISADEPKGQDGALLGRESVARQGVRAVLAAPMPGGGAKRGVLYVDRLRSGGRFDEEDLAFLAEVARQLGAALAALGRTHDAREETEAWRRLATRPAQKRPAALVGESASFRAALEVAERAARSDAAVLLLGETGSGKELFARFVHDRSARAQGPFVAANCAAFPESLLESELFGHERGAFTGADKRRRGLFELAKGGTLFLDEVGEMPLALQAKLLRALETREVRRLGGEEVVKLDARVVAATNRALERAVGEKQFREDLYYRLAVLAVRIPSLRERPGDAERLAQYFLEEIAPRAGKPRLRLSAGALAAIRAARWPGNVRELRNAIERAVTLAEGDVVDADLFGESALAGAARADDAAAPPITIEEAERRAIVRALKHTGGKKGEASRVLGISHPTLNRKLKEYGLEQAENE